MEASADRAGDALPASVGIRETRQTLKGTWERHCWCVTDGMLALLFFPASVHTVRGIDDCPCPTG